MYNESQKLRYVKEKMESTVLPNNYLYCQFRHCEEYENELGKDISNFTVYEIIEYYKILNMVSIESLSVLNSQLSMYTQWCLQETLVKDNQNHFLEINLDMLSGCLNKLLMEQRMVSREDVISWCDQLPNANDAFIILFLFECGKSKNFADIVEFKLSDLNGNKAKLIDGRTVKFSDHLVELTIDSDESNTYYSITGTGAKKMPLVSDGRVVKNYPNIKAEVSEFQKSRRIYNKYTRALSYCGVVEWCTASSLTESGKLHMIKERAKELNMTPIEYLYSDKIKEVENQYGCKIVRSVYVKKYEDYLTD